VDLPSRKPGVRRRYFQLATAGMISQMKKRLSLHSAMPELLRAVVEARSNKYPKFNRSLLETSEFLSFMEKEIKRGNRQMGGAEKPRVVALRFFISIPSPFFHARRTLTEPGDHPFCHSPSAVSGWVCTSC